MSNKPAAAGAGNSPTKSFLNSIQTGDRNSVQTYLNRGESPDYKYGLALRVAIMYDQPEIVDLLLQKGADITKATKESFLEIAVLYSKKNPKALEIARRLIDHMIEKKLKWHSVARSGPEAGSPLIFDVAFRGTVPMMELFVEKGANLHITEEFLGRERNLLKAAMRGDNEPMVRYLQSKGLTLPAEEEESVENWMRKKAEVNREVVKGGRRSRKRNIRKKQRKTRKSKHPSPYKSNPLNRFFWPGR